LEQTDLDNWAEPSRPRRAFAGRAGWIVASQGLTSLSNFVLTVLVARAVDPTTFGWFALGVASYGVVLSLARSMVSQPLAIRFAVASDRRDDEVAAAAGAAVLVGAAGALVTLVLAGGVSAAGGNGAVLAVMGAVLPVVILQDLWRFAFFTVGTPLRAAMNDLVCVGAQVVLFGIVVGFGRASAVTLTLAWGVAAGLAAMIGVKQSGRAPRWRAAAPYLHRHKDLGGTLSLVTVIYLGSNYLVMFALGPILGVAALGALRGGNALFGPYNVMVAGLVSAGPAEASRLRARRPARMVPALQWASVGLAVSAVALGTALNVLPDRVGIAVLGDTWRAAAPLIPALACGAVARSATTGALVGLRVVEAKRDLVRISVIANVVSTIAALAGAAVGGLEAAAWGLAVGTWLAAVMAWRALNRYGRAAAQGQVRDRAGYLAPR
jgi:O-antigen/teichoic acid export membrane protein